MLNASAFGSVVKPCAEWETTTKTLNITSSDNILKCEVKLKFNYCHRDSRKNVNKIYYCC